MVDLVALKKLRYPRGPDGKEYNTGDTFTALSERDAKALTLVRAARSASDGPVVMGQEQPATKSDGLFRQQMQSEGQPGTPGNQETGQPARGRYRRGDLRAKE